MATRIFALVIGIDEYKSGAIWNLDSSADDARCVSQWLMQSLAVPKEHIQLLVNQEATKAAFENKFMGHLVNNPHIERNDAILIYFAGHGSIIRAREGWFENGSGDAQALCTYDYDSKSALGRCAGISDRSLLAMISELSEVKGNNITLILDCCFSSSSLSPSARDRRFVRCTPTLKATTDDLFGGLWRGAVEKKYPAGSGFLQDDCRSHVTILPCQPGEKASEEKDGGTFTREFIAMSKRTTLHDLPCSELIQRLSSSLGRTHHQHPVCVGHHRDRVLFSGAPFSLDPRFVPIDVDTYDCRVEMGAMHGVVLGTEFSIHGHNRRCSLNPPLDNCRVIEVFPTWSIARRTSRNRTLQLASSWAQVRRWNNRTPFRIHVKNTFSSFFRKLISCFKPSTDIDGLSLHDEMNIEQVHKPALADISIGVHTHDVRVEAHDRLMLPQPHAFRIDKSTSRSSILDEAARFYMHLHRTNPENPFENHLSMDLFKVEPRSGRKIGASLVNDGAASVLRGRGAYYGVTIRNNSNSELWPYLAFMDVNGFDIHFLYHPSPATEVAPLPPHSSIDIGCNQSLCPPFMFPPLLDGGRDSGFLKLFVSTTYTSMGQLEQKGASLNLQPSSGSELSPATTRSFTFTRPQWDTSLVRLDFDNPE